MNARHHTEYTIPGFDALPATRATQRQPTPRLLAPVGDNTVERAGDGGRLSADAGRIGLTDLDDQLGLTRAWAAVLADARAARRLHCTPEDLLTQRVWQMAAGEEEANDAHPLRPAPILTLLLHRLPATGAPLASQPTLSRFEKSVSRPASSRMALGLMAPCIAASNRPPEAIGLAVDDTEDRAHGAQEPLRDDGSDGGDCFLPWPLYEGLSGRRITAILKAKRCSGAQRLAGRKRVVQRLRHAWPDPWGSVRGDRPCASPEVRAWIAAHPQRH
jgi:Transposase DDE domain group 1